MRENMKKYRVLFKGDIASDKSILEVQQKLAKLFNIDQKKTDKLFSGQTHIIKRNADLKICEKIQSAMKVIGAISFIEPQPTKETDGTDKLNSINIEDISEEKYGNFSKLINNQETIKTLAISFSIAVLIHVFLNLITMFDSYVPSFLAVFINIITILACSFTVAELLRE